MTARGWRQEAALRMLMNNLDPEVAERPQDLVVYGGSGKAARNWNCFHAIVRELERLGDDETLLVQSGKPVAVFRTHDELILSFTDRPPDGLDFVVARDPTGRPLFDDYLDQNRGHGEVDPGWPDRVQAGLHYHLCSIGARDDMLAFQDLILAGLRGRVRTFVQKSPRYAGTMCEVLHIEASKWAAILHLAELWDVAPEEICAVGDDVNDVPMLEGAGLGVAMGHAPPEVLAAADHVTGDHDNDGVAMLVDRLLLG